VSCIFDSIATICFIEIHRELLHPAEMLSHYLCVITPRERQCESLLVTQTPIRTAKNAS